MVRENSYKESMKFVKSLKEEAAAKETAAIQEKVNKIEAWRKQYFNIINDRVKRERFHGRLLESCRDDCLSSAIKAIYITSLENYCGLSDDETALAETIVDNWVKESGGASAILSTKNQHKSYLLARIAQIVEEAAQRAVYEVEQIKEADNDDEEDDEEEVEVKAEKDGDEEKVEVKEEEEKSDDEESDDDDKEDDSDDEDDTEDEEESEESEEDSDDDEESDDDDEDDVEPGDFPDEDLDKDTDNDDIEDDEKEEDTEDYSDEIEIDMDDDDDEESDDAVDYDETESDDEGDEEVDVEVDDEEDSDGDETEEVDVDVKDSEGDEEVSAEEEEDAGEEILDDTPNEDEDDGDVEDTESNSDDISSDDDEVYETDGEDADNDGVDDENDAVDSDQMYKDLQDEEDVKKAIDTIQVRVADAEEKFIKKNAEDKKKVDELLHKINNSVKTVEEIDDDDNLKSQAEQEHVIMYKRQINDLANRAPKSVFEAMANEIGRYTYLAESAKAEMECATEKVDTSMDAIIGKTRILYGFLETLNTLKLEDVNENYIKKVIEDIN